MDIRDWMQENRLITILLATVIGIMLIVMIAITIVIGRNTYVNMRLSTICPDYFTYEYAYVVDEKGRGIDSVAVSLWDNSNIHLVYRTFTDSTGRFVLFHDLGSFTLPNIPLSYFLNVSFEGWNDTIRYSFERNRICHFRKIDGPDTIVYNRGSRSILTLRLEQAAKVMIDSGYALAPYEEIVLSERPPEGVDAPLPFDTVFYTTIPAGASPIPFAVVPVRGGRVVRDKGVLLTEGTYYTFDRDGDRDLKDEQLLLFAGAGRSVNDGIIDCTARTCRTVDSVRSANSWYFFNLQLRGMDRKQPLLRYRRGDALRGLVTLTSSSVEINKRNISLADFTGGTVVGSAKKYEVFLWDRRGVNFTDLSAVVLGIDRNGDGIFDSREGNSEMYEHAEGRIVLDSMSFVIDTIAPDGQRMFCSDIRNGVEKPADAMVGTWARDFTAAAACPLSLYLECGANRYVVLYFFAGSAAKFMEASEISNFMTIMRDQLGPVRIIGINRQSTGELYSREPVINENHGWQGPLVRQFHNHRSEEIVCLDATATIVYRGAVGIDAIAAIWEHAGVDNAIATSLYEQQYAGREMRKPE